jgi:hypothetical protein
MIKFRLATVAEHSMMFETTFAEVDPLIGQDSVVLALIVRLEYPTSEGLIV